MHDLPRRKCGALFVVLPPIVLRPEADFNLLYGTLPVPGTPQEQLAW